jgi:hypothetical protein
MNLNSIFLPSGKYATFYDEMSNVNLLRAYLNINSINPGLCFRIPAFLLKINFVTSSIYIIFYKKVKAVAFWQCCFSCNYFIGSIHQNHTAIVFFNTRSDMTFQILGVQHLLNGEGLSFAHISADNLSAFQYRPITKWPPVFSLLYIPFYILFGKNYIAAAIAMGIVAAIGLIFVTRAILKTLDLPIVYINLFTLLTGFFGYYFYTIPNTDPVGITIFLFACYLCLKMIKKGKTSNTSLFLFMLALLASGLFKYLFILPTMVIPFF